MMPSSPSREKDWLDQSKQETARRINEAIDKYDNAHLTREEARRDVGIILTAELARVYDHAFAEGMKAVELDGDYEDDEEIDFEADDDED